MKVGIHGFNRDRLRAISLERNLSLTQAANYIIEDWYASIRTTEQQLKDLNVLIGFKSGDAFDNTTDGM
ncbi:hypothetical protein [Litorilituus sediminis]|uniref:Uncharacterized protein n=1 Tax=Litorilituus sediminis TaxID=718192 RepID=A0A4P6P366_9GAMM|nr:hypothetical protein [Litorilituus sediminis]QBG34379.1 hypothetical protein EMK97_00810 [Litorilituus sediminis]